MATLVTFYALSASSASDANALVAEKATDTGSETHLKIQAEITNTIESEV
jgi:hypothetical protein